MRTNIVIDEKLMKETLRLTGLKTKREAVVNPQSEKLDALLGVEQLLTGDLILTEVLQGFVSDRDFNQARKLLASMPLVSLIGEDIALQAAKNFRKLRTLGITIRKKIDTLIATSCIEKELSLLYRDRDFDPFVQHLGLRSANRITR